MAFTIPKICNFFRKLKNDFQQNENVLNNNNDNAEYIQTLLNCVVACEAIYEEDPKAALSDSKLSHGIRQVALNINHLKKENDNTRRFSNLKVNYMICESSNHHKKQLVVAFRETEGMSDFLLNLELNQQIHGCDGYCHSSVFFQSAQVPLDYFIDKIMNEDYEIVFTGHSLGASVASLVAVRLLMDKRLKKQKNVLFIGFGSPPFVDEAFKRSIEVDFKNNFHFYLNENDSIVKLLHVMICIYTDKTLITTNDHSAFITSVWDYKNFKLDDHVEFISKILLKSDYVKKENFCLFGWLIKSDKRFVGIHLDNVSQDFEKQLKLRNKKDHSIHCYLSDIEKHYLNNIEGLYQKKSIILESLTDLCLPDSTEATDDNYFSVSQVVNEFNTDIFIDVHCKNNEFINGAVLKGFQNDIQLSNISFQNSTKAVTLVFSCPNTLLFDQDKQSNKIRRVNLKCIIHSQFNSKEIIFNTRKTKLNEGFSQKRQQIEKLPLDKLYMSAIIYFKMFSQSQYKLMNIFRRIDDIWNIKNKKHSFNDKKNKYEIQKRFLEYFEGETDSISDILDGSFDINEQFVSLEECANANTDCLNQVIKNAPTFLQLMKFQCSGATIPSYWALFSQCSYKSFLRFPCVMPITMKGSYQNTLDYYILNRSKDNRSLIDYDGCYEAAIVKSVIENRLKIDKNDKILQTILLNRQIRDILIEYFLFGVVGKSKCGKSTFVQNMTGMNTNAGFFIVTKQLIPYKITDSVMLVDYPHFESTDPSHEILFLFTRYLLDHVFVVTYAAERMDTNETVTLFKLTRKAVGNNFTILLNKADDSIIYCKKDSDFGKAKFQGIINDVCKRIGAKTEKQVFLTCLKNFDDLEEFDAMNKTMVLNAKKLKGVVYRIIQDKIPGNAQFLSLKKEVSDQLDESNKKEMHKKIIIKDERRSEAKYSYIITLDRSNCKPKTDYVIIDSFEHLVNLQMIHDPKLNLKYPIFRLEPPKQGIINRLEDFFETEDHVFIVSYN